MKIVLVNNLFGKFARGGAEVIVETLVDELSNLGHDVTVITAGPFGKNLHTVQMSVSEKPYTLWRFFPYNLYFIGNDHTHAVWVRFLWHIFDTYNIFSYFKIKKILKNISPDIVWTHNLKGIGFLTALAIRTSGAKHIHTLHDVQLVIPSGLLLFGQENNWKNKNIFIHAYAWITKKLFGSPQLVLSPSHWLMDFYSHRGFFLKSKKMVLQNPVVGNPIDRGNNINHTRTFLYVGQIEGHKGIFFLLDVWRSLNHARLLLESEPRSRRPARQGNTEDTEKEESDKIKNVELIIIGSGSKEEKLKKELETISRVRYLGKLSHDEVGNWYQKADYLIFPTLCYENAPTVILEAFLHKLPVIASDLGSVSEFIQEEKTGFLFAPKNKKKLLELLMQIFEGKKNITHSSFLNPPSPEVYIQKVFNDFIDSF